MRVQKENSPKTVPTRPAGLRRGAEKEKRKEQETGKGLEKEKADTKKKATLEPGNTAETAAVKFDAGSKRKLTENRPDETGGSPKRSRKGKMKGKGSVKRTRKGKGTIRKARRRRNRETRPGTPVSSLMQVQKENSPKTVRTRPAGLRRGAKKEKTRKRKREHHSHRNQLPGLYKNSTTEVKVVEYSHRNQLPGTKTVLQK